MSSKSEDQPYSESNLQSPAYRKRLLRKLNTLIAVLDVACSKVRRSLNGSDPDVERLTRIHKNLKDTLEVCRRAKRALEQRQALPAELPPILGEAALKHGFTVSGAEALGAPKRGTAVEMSSEEEQQKFDGLGPILSEEIRAADLDDLCRKLLFGL